jgi:hypothetical protein
LRQENSRKRANLLTISDHNYELCSQTLNEQQQGPAVVDWQGGEGILEAQERIEDDSMPQKNSDGRDELNLAEFPLCALAHRLRPEQKTLRFEDRVWDECRGENITRQLTITGSDAYGLPTALDDEVLLGLIQLSRLNQFAERAVRFTRYQLIQLLGWRQESKSYERVEASLKWVQDQQDGVLLLDRLGEAQPVGGGVQAE